MFNDQYNYESKQDFTTIVNINLYQNSYLQSEMNFKKGEDFKISVEKQFQHKNVSSIYLNQAHNLLADMNDNLRKTEQEHKIQNLIFDKQYINQVCAFWDLHMQPKQSQFLDYYEIHDSNFKQAFSKVCIEYNKQISLFLQKIYKQDQEFIDFFRNEEQKLENQHSQEITQACSDGHKQIQIAELVNKHLKRLDENLQKFKKQYEITFQENILDFKKLIHQLLNKNEPVGIDQDYLSATSLERQQSKDCNKFDDKNKLNSKKSNNIDQQEQQNVQKFRIQVCLGIQSKYDFEIKLKNCDLEQYVHKCRNKPIKFSKNCQENSIYGINQQAIVAPFVLNEGQLYPDKNIQQLFKFRTDLHFQSFQDQFEHLTKKVYQQKDEEDVLNQLQSSLSIKSGDYLVTKHSNIGKIRDFYHLFFESTSEYIIDPDWLCFRKMFEILNNNCFKTLIIPLQQFIKLKYGTGASKINTFNLKDYAEILKKIIAVIKREINHMALQYPINHFLKKIVILIPNEGQQNQNYFDKAKEFLKNKFE